MVHLHEPYLYLLEGTKSEGEDPWDQKVDPLDLAVDPSDPEVDPLDLLMVGVVHILAGSQVVGFLEEVEL